MVLKLYGFDGSAPVRAVLLCGKALGLNFEFVDVNLAEGEQLQPEFLKINPQHTVPVLDDDGFILADSHAINAYLVGKYGKKDDTLYPENLQSRAIINHRLHFDSNILYVRGTAILRGILLDGEKYIPKSKLLALEEAFNITEKLLENKLFIAGNNVTIADFSIITSISTFIQFIPITEVRFPKLYNWYKKMEALPYYEMNKVGLDHFLDAVKEKIPN